ncbi:MAG: hypothetical protein IPG17_06045 [Sandaracinaceae bacterium]|jgi:hypothetical protein|nr:hypothetical protein [Sandaracinaceae bacterium]MBP7683505.1 hypothetical protein [Deltaproteobacteria bacterium]MBK6807729.1 hypothetical protein [Sandaracinaceae bacterium]MBK7155148.1 hypothetical protein [Sandaracinaceae bacterium]MBK7776246.1 hypothetical protein [Sandaracinaceae bacterium]
MKQSATERPNPSLQRKAAVANGAAVDHAGVVRVKPIDNFDLNRTIFQTLEGAAPRFVIKTRIAKEAHWDGPAGAEVERAYSAVDIAAKLPQVDPALLRFMADECDFDVEHADGSFLDHLYFCFEYGAAHYPEHSPLVLLLHSILGTGTNTFAMKAEQIPKLRSLMNDFDWKHVEAFPSVLRLLYNLPLRRELRDNLHRLDSLKEVSFRRVIDNQPITMSGEDFFIQLNFQLIHLVDFLPVANWAMHQNDTAFILFRDLYDLLERAGKKGARLRYTPASGPRQLVGETQGLGGRLTTLIPVSLSEKMAAGSVQKFSKRIGHSLEYKLTFSR